jgi:hypothetical protein
VIAGTALHPAFKGYKNTLSVAYPSPLARNYLPLSESTHISMSPWSLKKKDEKKDEKSQSIHMHDMRELTKVA